MSETVSANAISPTPARMTETRRILRFLLCGGLAAAINWVIRFPLSAYMPFELAVPLAYAIGMTAGFTLYRGYVFPASPTPLRRQIRNFLLVNLVGGVEVWLIAVALIRYVMPGLGWTIMPEGVAHGVAIGIGAITSYVGHKYLTFHRGDEPVA